MALSTAASENEDVRKSIAVLPFGSGVVLTANAGDFSLVGNFDINVGSEAAAFWGASLAAGYAFTPQFGMAVGSFWSVPK